MRDEKIQVDSDHGAGKLVAGVRDQFPSKISVVSEQTAWLGEYSQFPDLDKPYQDSCICACSRTRIRPAIASKQDIRARPDAALS
jgi:hypothetical protein